MPDTANNDDTRRELSLLALGEALREQPAAPSRLAQAIAEVRAEQSASRRHRLARSRREAHEGPLLSALRVAGADTEPATQSETEAVPPEMDSPAASQTTPKPADGPEPARAQTPSSPKPEPIRPARQEPPVEPPVPLRARGAAQSPAPEWAASPAGRPDGGEAEPDRYGDRTEAPDDQWKPLIDPAKVLAGVMRSKRLIVATTLAGALIGVAIAITTPKTYEAYTELLADPRDLNLVDRELTQSGLSNEATLAIVENQVRILTSGSVLTKVVDRLELQNDPEFNGQAGSIGIRSLIGNLRSLVSGGSGSADPGRGYTLAVEHLAENLSVERSGKTFVIVISARSRDPEKSALIANTMTEVFLEAYGQLQSDAAGRAADELTSKLDELRDGVEAAERKVETYKAEREIIDPQGRLLTDDEIAKLNDQLSTALARTLELNARVSSMRSVDLDAVLGGDLPESLTSPTIQELRAQYAALNSESDRLSVRLGPRHPQRMQVEAQLSGKREQIKNELRRIVASAQTELKRAVLLEQELSSRLAQLKVKQGSVSSDLVTLRELERDSAAKRAVYEAYLRRARETGEQQGINSANMSVISKASPPFSANPPSRSTIAMTGTMMGFLFGLGLGVLRGTVDSLRDTMGGSTRRKWRPRLLRPVPTDPGGPGGGDRAAVPPADTSPSLYLGTAKSHAGTVPDRNAPPAVEPAQSREDLMPNPAYSAYPQFAPQQPAAPYPQAPAYAAPYHPPQQPPAYPHYAWPEAYPQQPAPQAYAPPYYAPQPAAQHPQPQQHWHQPPVNAYPYPQAAPMQPSPYAPQPLHQQPPVQPYVQPAPESRHAAPAQEAPQTPIEEIRASLREFRDAIKELSEQRSRRRYF